MQSEMTIALVDRHLEAWRLGNIPALIADYCDDAVMLNGATGVVAGKAAIEAMLAQVFVELFPPGDTELKVDGLLTNGDHALIHYTAITSTIRTVGAFDGFSLRGGKIAAQFSGGDVVPLG